LIVYWKIDHVKQNPDDLDAEETEEKTRRRFLSDIIAFSISNNANCRKL
jgi:hypothetical protein